MSRLERYKKIVNQALQDQNPQLGAELAATGMLDEYLTEFAQMLVEAFSASYGQASHMAEVQKLPPMEKVGRLNALEKEIEEVIFAELLEFPEDDPEDDESGEPEVPPEIVAIFERMSVETAAAAMIEKAE